MLNSPKEWPANAARLAKLQEDSRVRLQGEAALALTGWASSQGSAVWKVPSSTCVMPQEQVRN